MVASRASKAGGDDGDVDASLHQGPSRPSELRRTRVLDGGHRLLDWRADEELPSMAPSTTVPRGGLSTQLSRRGRSYVSRDGSRLCIWRVKKSGQIGRRASNAMEYVTYCRSASRGLRREPVVVEGRAPHARERIFRAHSGAVITCTRTNSAIDASNRWPAKRFPRRHRSPVHTSALVIDTEEHAS